MALSSEQRPLPGLFKTLPGLAEGLSSAWLGDCGVVAMAAVAGWLVNYHAAALPDWAPWEFSWPAFLAAAYSLLWFVRGLRRTQPADRLPRWRQACFLLGWLGLCLVLLSRFELLAQHMFFFNRVQHLVMHHLGPFLIALSWPGATIARGMPPPVRRLCDSGLLRRSLRVFQQPVLAAVLFEGLLALWLVPPVMFWAMLDWRLYGIMNASMVIDGLLFWFLVLDPRPKPLAPIGFFTRAALAFVIMFPQIAIGTAIGMARTDLYPTFSLCGRVYPSIGPLLDQQIGGLVLWIPAGMMSALATVLIMRRLFLHDDSVAQADLALRRPDGTSVAQPVP